MLYSYLDYADDGTWQLQEGIPPPEVLVRHHWQVVGIGINLCFMPLDTSEEVKDEVTEYLRSRLTG
jgi:hypothetical protein